MAGSGASPWQVGEYPPVNRDQRISGRSVGPLDVRYHFSGIAGVGMNPLAQLMRSRGHAVQGSDRSFDKGKNLDVAGRLTELGIVVKPQDGSAVSPNLDRFVYSTAVEAETPEVRAARAYGIERVPRPALLAEVVDAGRPGVAIAGTSGKSTITMKSPLST